MAWSRAALVLLFALFAFSGAALADDLADDHCSLELRQLRSAKKVEFEAEAEAEAGAEESEGPSRRSSRRKPGGKAPRKQLSPVSEEVESEEFVPSAEVGGGNCMNDADQKIWTNGGHAKFDEDGKVCSEKCGSNWVTKVDPQPILDCIRDCILSPVSNMTEYSPGCEDCLAGLVECAASAQCNEQAAVRNAAIQTFVSCSGLTDVLVGH
ncbi:unnamed protein product [Polarella glacialis]|uniref:Uncharacterized protein n=1 Tax=Polarella glacialis TaxID=89957 RepID=A0A813I5W7_POLGL|nr:unnamed protein product [Polarella glacialis]